MLGETKEAVLSAPNTNRCVETEVREGGFAEGATADFG